ncbi:sugar fermentation stimulation protein SfsA [Acidithiobacillus marinus]|uniref:Sugar fermentation stimulation protein homolog n=1 Tax=Acidithiobacillus marinus TaxID=187490 RepID=A0A2I1DMS0_9PROT|nr:DNA/RNA nuclease SfsA [Acidithiobacillus marinus]PKY11167.1 sugar fermentation stimulation protein SfsA [Acidithiobacillus marinus]
MQLPELIPATLLRRYKRFLADCRLASGEEITIHCPNSGSMTSCAEPGQPILISRSDNPRRKLAWTWELYWSGSSWVCVNTQHPNSIVAEAIACGQIAALQGYSELRREVPYGQHERVDILLQEPGRAPCYVEVKSCTLLEADGVIRFPDAVSTRALRHLTALRAVVESGGRAVMFFLIGREDGQGFAPADRIDRAYGLALREARQNGVEILAYRSRVSPDKIEIDAAEELLF